MKKYLTLAAGFLATISFGQCTIVGSSTIKINETAPFSVNAKAQCEECYSWKPSPDQNFTVDGNTKSNVINVKAANPGQGTISVSILSDKGLLQCEKTIDVFDAKQDLTDKNCGVFIDDFKEVKVTESVISFFPNENSNDYLYKWAVTYINGDTQESTEKIPQFFFSDINYITSVKLKITTKTPLCSVTLSKKFEQSYWKPTSANFGSIEQKAYSQGSYSDYVKKDNINNGQK